MLVVWSYNLDNIIPTCRDFEDKLIKLVWNQRSAFTSLASSTVASSAQTSASDVNLTEKATEVVNEKEVEAIIQRKKESSQPKKSRSWCGLGYWVSSGKGDVEKAADGPAARPTRLLAPIYGGFAAGLSVCKCYEMKVQSIIHILMVLNVDYLGSGVDTMIQEIVLDGSYVRLALLVTLPFLYCISLVSNRNIRCEPEV